MTLTQWKRLPKDEKRVVVQKYAMMFACEVYKRENPGCDDQDAFTHAERTWHNWKEKAFDLLALEMALEENPATVGLSRHASPAVFGRQTCK